METITNEEEEKDVEETVVSVLRNGKANWKKEQLEIDIESTDDLHPNENQSGNSMDHWGENSQKISQLKGFGHQSTGHYS
jgi:hypothetical protein